MSDIRTYKPNDEARIQAMRFEIGSIPDAKMWAGKQNLRMTNTQEWEVRTLEGWVEMHYGSYLINGTNGEFYPCAEEVFKNRWMLA